MKKTVWAVTCMATLAFAETMAASPARNADEIRDIVADVLGTEYCGTAIMDGVDQTAALAGNAPVAGRGFVRVEEAEWRPVVLGMAKEEFARRLGETPELVENIHNARAALSACKAARASHAEQEEALGVYLRATRELNRRFEKFGRMLVLLGDTGERDEEVDAFLERVVKECPQECDALSTGILAWVRRTLREQRAERCLELGRWIREQWGFESPQHGMFVRTLFPGLGELCRSDSERGAVARYLLAAVEHYEHHGFCRGFDMYASDYLPGWTGSLQRKRLAARFRNESVLSGTTHWDDERREYVPDVPTQRDVEKMLWSRAASELSAKDTDLTDLREVYGDWTKEGEGKNAQRGACEP